MKDMGMVMNQNQEKSLNPRKNQSKNPQVVSFYNITPN